MSAYPEETPDHLKELKAFLGEFHKESERGAALLAGSMIDARLTEVLRAYLIEGKATDKLLDGFNAPLGTFSARAAACVSMGLISEREFKEIETIRSVRNEFGHKLGITFESQRVSALCDKLTMSIDGMVPPGKVSKPSEPRNRFITAAVSVIIHLVNRPHYVGLRKLKPEEWPF